MRQCKACQQEKPLSEFYKGKQYKGGYRPLCKSCHKGRYPSQSPENVLERMYASRSRNGAFLIEYFRTHPCVDCGEADPIVLEFDHVRGKKKSNVGKLAHSSYSLSVLQEEIDKCDVVCANCHRRRTAKTQMWAKAHY